MSNDLQEMLDFVVEEKDRLSGKMLHLNGMIQAYEEIEHKLERLIKEEKEDECEGN